MSWKRWSPDHARNYWNFSWEALDVLLSGRSAIDMDMLAFYDHSEATHFLNSYGFCLANPDDAKKAHAILIEAIGFISLHLMPEEWKQGVRPPSEVLECDDPRKLLLWASTQGDLLKDHRIWSCSILRVMHTIAHLDRLERAHEHHFARRQIQARFSEFLMEDPKNQIWFGHDNRKVPLADIEWKRKKSRNSIILKLLHKPANVSETIYDHLGIRMTTYSVADAVVVLKLLREFDLVSFANTNPNRARNNLIDLKNFKTEVDEAITLHAQQKIDDNELLTRLVQYNQDESTAGSPGPNPHSSEMYKSIQITCRLRVSYPNPALSWLHKLR